MRAKPEKIRHVSLHTAVTSGVAITTASNPLYNTSQSPYAELVNQYRTVVKLNPITMTIACTSGGGAADAQGQKLWTFPEGFIDVERVMISGSLTPATGLSATTTVCSLGTAAATADDAALTGTEADILASTTWGDGTLASATAEAQSVAGAGVAGVLDGSSTAKDCYLNIGATWVKASGTTSTIAIASTTIIVDWVWLGDD
jgi:hypothetical protein